MNQVTCFIMEREILFFQELNKNVEESCEEKNVIFGINLWNIRIIRNSCILLDTLFLLIKSTRKTFNNSKVFFKKQ